MYLYREAWEKFLYFAFHIKIKIDYMSFVF